jgi:hypothetical protein
MARKKKVDTTIQNLNDNANESENTNISLHLENENVIMNTNVDNTTSELNATSEVNTIITKSKRGRKSKKELLLLNAASNAIEQEESNNEHNIVISNSEESEENQQIKSVAKKRGRKPKGGKIIQQVSNIVNIKESKPNVILHLKCHLKDLYNNVFQTNINGYDLMSNKSELYEVISNNENVFLHTKSSNNNTNNTTDMNSNFLISNTNLNTNVNYKNPQYDDEYINNSSNDEENYKSNKNNDLKDLWKKLKNLQHSLHLNNISDKKSACFWCTYEFDNPPIYIPKHYIKDSYHVYGCFCSPECATAYLMEENIDSSTKFERYHLLNHIYSKIYDYKKNIKPAPKPYYILEKFYGNLNIQEYRSLLKNERLFLVVDKPLTRILPELHEDNDDFIINNKIIPSNTYQIKRKLLQKQSKNNILSEKFGLQQNS